MTNGLLLQDHVNDNALANYASIMIDEAQETRFPAPEASGLQRQSWSDYAPDGSYCVSLHDNELDVVDEPDQDIASFLQKKGLLL
ncbi:hypothetical protein FOIG_13475 [Fusarium odoratissimum NRRL 54006]|uniref:Uncharacterized protein n=1 Tax=Fusarium odoratissimum (strain NRRL 54006) TaxID=1089451 RepID=X0K9E7_FUSO5|nr:uncharacterized protein FOIG_13475 [Fusarium odoratissimum NRRL 54006]EXL93629.1 hypothetical protein FOIG_13475 [Fusarium odoratissimum NRRL 54006]